MMIQVIVKMWDIFVIKQHRQKKI
ncbi:uncharacterized protein METZ01_LOCUS349676 [marine metagenome]|uniref:Uncharacterized protein n=1 Tax=marine metagenome TaxID=408172 RepID=A0A382RHW9_9ZZZZ